MLQIMIVEDNTPVRKDMRTDLECTGETQVLLDCVTGEDAVAFCREHRPDAIVMDVQLGDGIMSGIDAAVAIRRMHPRLPVVFYSVADDDQYFRAFLQARFLTHYAYVRKSNYLSMRSLVIMLKDIVGGRSFIDPEIATRVQEVDDRDRNNPMKLLESVEQDVARLLARGMTNEQIAVQLGYHEGRYISRINGQIYTAWGLGSSPKEEKIARLRAGLIYREGRLITWEADGTAFVETDEGVKLLWQEDNQ